MANFSNLSQIIEHPSNSDKTALIDLSKGTPRTLTYSQLHKAVNHFASHLLSLNLAKGSPVAIIEQNSIEFVIAFLACAKAGLVSVLINFNLPREQILKLVSQSDCRLILCGSNFSSFNIKNIPTILLDQSFNKMVFSVNPCSCETILNSEAFIIFTSGSSLNPKGVLISHRAHCWTLQKKLRIMSGEYRPLITAPAFHMNGLHSILLFLAYQETVILAPFDNLVQYVEAIENHQIATLCVVPAMLSLLCKHLSTTVQKKFLNIKIIFTGSAAIHENLLVEAKTFFPKARLINQYGSTEVGPGLFGPHPKQYPTPPLSVGYPRSEIDYRLVDGILQIRSPSAMTGYLKGSSVNHLTTDGFFNTNDLFRVDDLGFYYFLGRKDDIINCGGYKVQPAEVETILCRHPLVRSAVVFGLADHNKGFKPYAFILGNAQNIDVVEIKKFCAAHLPLSHCPRQIWTTKKWPTNDQGKINRQMVTQWGNTLLNLTIS